MQEIVSALTKLATLYGVAVLGALVILAAGIMASRYLTSLITRVMQKAKADETLVSFCGNVMRVSLYAVVIIAALGQAGVPTGSVLAMFGAAALGIGMALKGSLANAASGVMILAFHVYGIGDFVEGGGTMGAVEQVNIWNTVLTMPDGRSVTVPNNNMVSGQLINYSRKLTRRIDLVIGVGYEDDLEQAKEIINEVLESEPRVLTLPEPFVGVLDLADSSVNLAVRPWVATGDYWLTRSDLLEKIKGALDAGGLHIPYPQTDVHLHGLDGGMAGTA